MIYAGIGSRGTPQNVLDLFVCFASYVGYKGWRLRSGGAQGADYAFKHGCETVGGVADIFIPWNGYNGLQISDGNIAVHAGVGDMALRHARQFHPGWEKCSEGAKKLHARNSYIILSRTLRLPVDVVVCWTKDGKAGGGTGQAIRIARDRDIPVLDLGSCCSVAEAKKALNDLYRGKLPC